MMYTRPPDYPYGTQILGDRVVSGQIYANFGSCVRIGTWVRAAYPNFVRTPGSGFKKPLETAGSALARQKMSF
jgi:hypothetical protein